VPRRYVLGMIWEEAADEAHVSDPNAWKRRSELVKRDWIEVVRFRGQVCKRESSYHKRCQIYRITAEGRRAYEKYLAGHPPIDEDASHRRRLSDPDTSWESSTSDWGEVLYKVLGAFYRHTTPR